MLSCSMDRAAIWRRPLGHRRAVGDRDLVRRQHRRLRRDPLARDACGERLSPGLFPRRAYRRTADPAGRARRARQDARLMGRRHGAPAIHAVEFPDPRRRFRRQRPQGHLEQRPRRARLHCQLSHALGLEARIGLGLRSRHSEAVRLSPQPRDVRRMARARPDARRRQAAAGCRRRHPAVSQRRCGTRIPRRRELFRHQALQQLRRVCARRRSSGRSRARVRPDPNGVAQRRPPALAQRAHRLAAQACRAGPCGERLRGPDRFRPARRDPQGAGQTWRGAGRASDAAAPRKVKIAAP